MSLSSRLADNRAPDLIVPWPFILDGSKVTCLCGRHLRQETALNHSVYLTRLYVCPGCHRTAQGTYESVLIEELP